MSGNLRAMKALEITEGKRDYLTNDVATIGIVYGKMCIYFLKKSVNQMLWGIILFFWGGSSFRKKSKQ